MRSLKGGVPPEGGGVPLTWSSRSPPTHEQGPSAGGGRTKGREAEAAAADLRLPASSSAATALALTNFRVCDRHLETHADFRPGERRRGKPDNYDKTSGSPPKR